MTYDFSKTPEPYDFSKNHVVKAWDEFEKKDRMGLATVPEQAKDNDMGGQHRQVNPTKPIEWWTWRHGEMR